MVKDELRQIKKIYGEEMMHLCRRLFPTILEYPGVLLGVLTANFAPTKMLAQDIKRTSSEQAFCDLVNYLATTFIERKNVDPQLIPSADNLIKTPQELLRERGYILYECKTEEEIQQFRKYYAPGEELCTFTGNESRILSCYVFFAVKVNVDEIRRENFDFPKRQDEYGTSVISIQFSRGEANTLSIKNRYNHTVDNPDATFSNNLENIITGLTASFEKFYGFKIIQQPKKNSVEILNELPYIIGNDGKYYRYNYEINGIYYCENNIIIDHGVVIENYAKERERYIVIDYFIIDKKEKKVLLYDMNIQDSFIDTINQLGEIKNITSTKDGIIVIEYNDGKRVYIRINSKNEIIDYKNEYVQEIGGNFMFMNKTLLTIEVPRVESIGNSFLAANNKITHIQLPRTQVIGKNFLFKNRVLSYMEIPMVKYKGIGFLQFNRIIEHQEIISDEQYLNNGIVGFDDDFDLNSSDNSFKSSK